MLQFLWLARLRERWLSRIPGRSRKRNRAFPRQRPYRRLELERLEHRLVPSVTLLGAFAGTNLDQSGGYVPPDTQGGAGPKSYVETVNSTVSMYNKSGGTTIAQDSLQDFLFTQGNLPHIASSDALSDAFSTYDPLAGRFIVGDIDVQTSNGLGPANALLFAVSKSNNPTSLTSSDWYFYEINTTEPGVALQDYPGNLGYNNGALVITENYFGNGPSHVLVNALSINALTSGATMTLGTNYFQTDFNGFSLRPATMQDSASVNDPMWFVEEGGDDQSINVVKMANVLSSTPTFTTTNLAVNPYSPAVPELNPDGSAINGNTDSRIMNASMQNGMLVAAHQVSNAAGNLDEIQWYEINTNGGTPNLQQQGDLSGGAGTYYSYPGIAINSAGMIGMSYIASGTNTPIGFMSTYVTGRNPGDSAGTMEKPVLAMAGTVLDNDGRQGDMSAINVDSDGTFWIANEIAVNNPISNADSWGTAIAHFSLGTSVSTKTSNLSAVYSPNAQKLALSAAVTNVNTPSSPINEGTVTFTLKSGTTIVGSVSGAVIGGTANANLTLPTGLNAGNYTIAVSYTDSLNTFVDISDTNGTLTISPAKATAAANNVLAAYSPNRQTVALSTTLTDTSIGADKVSEGAVTFTVRNGSKLVGRAVGNVTGGTANADFTLPAGEALGNYSISVSYSDSSGNFLDNGDTGATLTIAAANAVTTASNIFTAYSPNAQTVTLNAAVADASVPTDTVGEGAVTFTVKNGNTVIDTLQSAVTGGMASASLNLAAGQALGTYSVAVSYSDSSGNYTDGGDNDSTLTISAANVTTTASNVSAFFSPNGQTLALTANLANNSISTNTVNEGVVTFTILSGGTALGSVQGNVTGGTANANFNLPAGLAAGTYAIAVRYNDSLNNFSDNGDVNGTLTIAPAKVATTAAASNITFSTAGQTLALNATLADNSIPSDRVGEGTVTFTIKNNQSIIGNAYAAVSGGAASANFTWSAGRPAGNYTIAVSYADSAGNYTDNGDTSNTLTVAAANVTVAAGSPSQPLISSSNAQNVTLNASVADASSPSQTVNEGMVTFTLKDSKGNTVGSPVQGTVTGGIASAVYSVPGGQPVGSYLITAGYSDSQGNFSDNGSGDTSGTLTINPANVATTASNASAIYSPIKQTLSLSANVANTSVPTNTVGEGVVTFTIMSGSTVVGTAQGNVGGGTANANFTLPAGLAPGSYTIAVSYSDTTGSGNFIDHGDTSAALTITPANITTAANKVAAVYSPNAQALTLSAAVNDLSIPADTVSEGIVTFKVANGSTVLGTVQGNVTGGTANANFNLPAGQALGIYTVTVSYSDSSGNFTDIADSGANLTVAPANVTIKAGSVPTVYSPNGQTLALSATVTDASIATDTVNEGVVTFTVVNGSTVLGSVQGNVSGGTANANFSLPGGQAVGAYTITVSYNDTSSHFLDFGDSSGTLGIAAAHVTTKANNVSAAFSPNTQTLVLSASVADASIATDPVSQGSVTFTVMSGSTTIGAATSLVSNGKAAASLSWPGGQALGNYSLVVSYSDSAGNFTDSGDSGAALTVAPASVTTKAGNVSSLYNLNSQTVTLTAALTDASVPSDIVTEGTVTFTVLNGSTALGSVQGTVTGGRASADFTAPAGLSAGDYTIAVSYSDSTGLFTDGGDTGGTLAVTPASVTTTASATNTTFNTGPQALGLNATVTDPGPAIPNVVNEGVVTFTILSGSTVLGSVQGAVNGDTAHADFTLPAGLAAGNYTVVVHYSDTHGNFADSGDANAILAVGTAATTTQLLGAHFEPNYTSTTVTETLTAHVASSTLVNRGTVTFALSTGQTISANVDGNGNATAVVNLPMQDLLNPQSINISYTDASHNLTASTNTQTASWQWSTPLAPTYAAFSSNSVTMDLFGLFITFTNGVLTEIDYGSTHLVFSYNTSGQLDQVTFDGMNLLP